MKRFFLLFFILSPLTLFAHDKDESPALDYYYNEANRVAHVNVLDAESENRVGGYENWKISAEVVEPFKGSLLKGEKIEYIEPTESGLKKERFLGNKVIFLKKNKQNKMNEIVYITLENSTVPSSEHVMQKMREIVQKAGKKKKTSRKIE